MAKKSSKLFGCNCLKSKCTKNYCECFTQGSFASIKLENVMNSVNAQDAKIREKFRRDIGPSSRPKMGKNFATARSQTVSKNTANATIVSRSAIVIVNAKSAKIKMT
jgi:hypothetical protein